MNDIKPIIFLVPVIALIATCILYFFLSKKTPDKKVFSRMVFTITILAFLLNFTWELIQMPFYRNSFYDIRHVSFCSLASLADAIMVLLLYFGLAFLFKDPLWIQPLKWQRIIILILIGGAGAVLSEMRHLSIGSWAYADSMPTVPIVKNVGLYPLLQFIILPFLIYYLSFRWIGSSKQRMMQ